MASSHSSVCFAAAVVAGSVVFGLKQAQASEEALAATPEGQRKAMKDAVLVFGATGKLGREIVAQVRLLCWSLRCRSAGACN